MMSARTRVEVIMTGLCVFTFGVVTWFSNPETGLLAGVTFGVFLTVVQTKREVRKESLSERRFWLLIIVLALIHIVAIFTFKISDFQFGLMVLPFALVDGFAMWWLINWIERNFH